MRHALRTSKGTILLVALSILPTTIARADHPRTVFDATTLEALQIARNTTHAEMATALVSAMNARLGQPLTETMFDDRRLLGNAIGGFAMASMMVGDATHRALAKDWLLTSLSWSDWGFGEGDDLNRGHLIIGTAVAYDVLYPLMTDTERQRVRTRIATEAQRFDTAAAGGIWWTKDWLQNHNWINLGALGVAGLALAGEDSRSAGWVARARANSATLKSVLDLVNDGSWHEGIGYQQYGWSMAMPYWMASDRDGVDVADHKMLEAHGTYRLWTQLPDQPRSYIAIHGDWSGYAGPGSSQVLRYVASKFRDGAAQEAARRWLAGGARSTRTEDTFYLALEYIAYDPSVTVADTSPLAPDLLATDQQLAVLRTGWNAGSLVLGFKAGVLGGQGNWTRLKNGGAPGGSLNISHDHMDDLGLWIFGDGQWLMPECVGYNIGRTSGPEAWRTEFHNALRVDGAGQLGDDKGSIDNALAHAWFFERRSHLSRMGATESYATAVADGTELYPSTTGLTSLTRTLVLAREGWVVLRDDVTLSRSATVNQLFHAMDGASVDGPWLRTDSKSDRVLGIRVVSPLNFAASVQDQTADKLTKQFEPDGIVKRIELGAVAPSSTHRFVELLWPTRGAIWSTRPSVAPLDTAHPEAGFVVPLVDGRESWAMGNGSTKVIAGRIGTTSALAIVRESAGGSRLKVALDGPGQLWVDGSIVLEASSAGLVEVRFDGATAHLSGADPAGLSFDASTVKDVVREGRPIEWYRDGAMIRIGSPSVVPEPPDAGGVDVPPTDPPVDPPTPTPVPKTVVTGRVAGVNEWAPQMPLPIPSAAIEPEPMTSSNEITAPAKGCQCGSASDAVGWILLGCWAGGRQRKARWTNQ